MEKRITQFPTSVKELDVLGWKNVDVVLFTGDAYIDHPGCTMKDMENLSNTPSLRGICTEQVQDFTPTPMTKSSVMYYTEMDTKTFERVFVEKNMQKKQVQKSYFFKK